MTDLYAVIGNPIGHTKSPLIQLAFAKQLGHDIDYVPLLVPIGGFEAKVDELRRHGYRGLNVTSPFKLNAFAYATELSEAAKLAGAVNCLGFEGERVIGQNFDGVGLTNDIQRNLGFQMQGRRVLVLGAGGAVRGALLPFLQQQPNEIVLVNRTAEKAHSLAQQFAPYGTLTVMQYDDLKNQGSFDLIVNATSSSLHGEVPPISAVSFAPEGLAYELAYGKGLTPFLRVAQEAGVKRIADGVGMQVEQAAEAFEFWRGVRPETKPMIEKLTVPLT